MPEFINTIDALGDDAVIDSIIERTITEFRDDQITVVDTHAFRGCAALQTIDLPNVTKLQASVFYGCTSLTDVNLPAVSYISGSGTFVGCSSLKKLKLPNLRSCATGNEFGNCTSLEVFDSSVQNIRFGAFNKDVSLKAFVNRADTVCKLEGTNSFTDTPIASGTGYIYVPGNLINSYRNATNWSTYANQFRGIIEDEDALQGIIDETLVDYENNEIESIPAHSFYNYAPLKSVKSDSVTEVGMNAFRLSGVTEVDFPELVTSGNVVFYDCKSLTQANFPKLTTVTTMMFSGCDKLTEVNIPNATAIESGAFQSCTALMKLDCPKVTAINGTNVFGFFNSNCMNTLILRSKTMCTLANTGSFGTGATAPTAIGKGTGYIYVPRALIEDYKVAANWSTYAAQFRALEDYTVDGTTTGELDESKI